MIYIHKELELEDVERRYPAEHYVLVDDKLRILTAIKKAWGRKVTTVFPKQGYYVNDCRILSDYPPADISIDRIGKLLVYDLETIIKAGNSSDGVREKWKRLFQEVLHFSAFRYSITPDTDGNFLSNIN